MKLVTLCGRIAKVCAWDTCKAIISVGEKCWRVSSHKNRSGIRGLSQGSRKYYCKTCGDEIQH